MTANQAPLDPPLSMYPVVLRAICAATNGIMGFAVDWRTITAVIARQSVDVLPVFYALDGDGLIAFDEDDGTITLTEAGAAWAKAKRGEWEASPHRLA